MSNQYNKLKQWRIDIHNMLSKDFENGFYQIDSKTKVTIPADRLIFCVSNTVKYSLNDLNLILKSIEKKSTKPITTTKANIRVINEECLDIALQFKNNGSNPVVLNMASAMRPGGGFKNGAGAQEESLFRRSCLHLCLKEDYYPLDIRSGIYTPSAIIIAESEAKSYNYLKSPELMSFISFPALNLNNSHNSHNSNHIQSEIDLITYDKIDAIFKIAILNNHDTIILSAFGCGAFGNDPSNVANIFKQVIRDRSYDQHFANIIFAIIEDYNSSKHGGNYHIFKSILET
jgi:uncharacterized protein (TIGR02452 family)